MVRRQYLARNPGFDPARIHMHGNNKTDEEILFASRAGVGHLILDSFDEIDRCERLLERPQDVLIRVTPGIKPSTHDYITTGQLDSKFGFGLADDLAARAVARVARGTPFALSDAFGAWRVHAPDRDWQIDVTVLPVWDGVNNTHSVGIGEPSTVPTAAAIANAVSHAIGARIRSLPITPESVLAALDGERAGGAKA